MRNSCCTKLHVFSFGLALGIVWGLVVLVTGLVAWATGYGAGFVETMRPLYLGYAATIPGGLIGGIWGFVDMFIIGAILAALYNLFFKISCKDKCVCMTTSVPKKTNSRNKHSSPKEAE